MSGSPSAPIVTDVTAPTLKNDLTATFIAKSIGTVTIAIGSHVTPMAYETLNDYPTLDIVIRHEPEYTLRELVQTLDTNKTLHDVQGTVFRHNGEIVANPDRPFIPNLDGLHCLTGHTYDEVAPVLDAEPLTGF